MIDKLKSRKFWVALVGAAYTALQGDMTGFVCILSTYLGAQGVADAVCSLKKK